MSSDRASTQFSPEELHRLGLVGLGLIHELATPLSTSVMSLQLLAEELDTDADLDGATIANRIQDEIRRLKKTVDTVHRFRMWLKDSEPHFTTIELNAVVELTVTALRPVLTQLNFPIPVCQFDHDVMVSIDEIWLERALGCLIMNAAQAAGGHSKSEGKVIVEVRRENTGMQIVVTDNGPGIQSERTLGRSTKEDGLGLGLYLAQTFIESMGGRIEIGNGDDGGGRATIHLIDTKTEASETDA